MSVPNRSAGRNVHVYDANNPDTEIGGLYNGRGVTNASFHSMVEICFLFTSDYYLRNEAGEIVPRDDNVLQPDKYYIVTEGSITVTNEIPLVRTISMESGSRSAEFRHAVRNRDKRCAITNDKAQDRFGGWDGFQAAHIFPLAYQGNWTSEELDQHISILPQRGGSINSVQNGILLRLDVHGLFDSYFISINPDDHYKIVLFTDKFVGGNCLDQEFLDRPDRPVDQVLRWHFKQAVLANMKGAGLAAFEQDFPSGSDMMGEILKGPMPEKMMEFQLFNRLALYASVESSP